jgi:4-hydroxybenzoate polyprenyltransferase
VIAFFIHFVYGNWWVGLGAAALAQLSWFELTGNYFQSSLFAFILGGTAVVYNLNMLSGLRELRASQTTSPRHHWCMAHEQAMKAHLAVGAILALGSFPFLSHAVWIILLPAVGLSLLYVFPIVNKKKLREFGIWKIFMIATVWAVVTVILPAVSIPNFQFSWELSAMILERWLFIFALTIPFDIRDIENDRAKGIQTIPLKIGYRQSIVVAIFSLVAFAVLAGFRLQFTGQTSSSVVYACVTLVSMVLISKANPNRSDLYFTCFIDGMMLLLAGSVFACTGLQ